MNQFDAKHGINRRRKNLFTAVITLVAMCGGLWAVTIVSSNPYMPDKLPSEDLLAVLPTLIFLFSGLMGLTVGFGFIAYKVLSWIDRPHAVASIRSILLSPDPYND